MRRCDMIRGWGRDDEEGMIIFCYFLAVKYTVLLCYWNVFSIWIAEIGLLLLGGRPGAFCRPWGGGGLFFTFASADGAKISKLLLLCDYGHAMLGASSPHSTCYHVISSSCHWWIEHSWRIQVSSRLNDDLNTCTMLTLGACRLYDILSFYGSLKSCLFSSLC